MKKPAVNPREKLGAWDISTNGDIYLDVRPWFCTNLATGERIVVRDDTANGAWAAYRAAQSFARIAANQCTLGGMPPFVDVSVRIESNGQVLVYNAHVNITVEITIKPETCTRAP